MTTEITTMFVVWVRQSYANYVGDPEAVFTTLEKAEMYVRRHVVPPDCRIEQVPVDPEPA